MLNFLDFIMFSSSRSFTYQSHLWFTRSEYFSPSPYKASTDTTTIQGLYKTRREKVDGVGHIAFKNIAKMVIFLSTTPFLATLGIGCHGVQSLRYRYLRSRASPEERQSLAQKVSDHQIALSEDVKALAPLVIWIASRRFSLPDFSLPGNPLFIPVVMKYLPMIFYLGQECHWAFEPESEDSELLSKYEFGGATVDFSPQQIRNNRYQALFDSIQDIQRVLPSHLKMPDYGYPMKGEVLNWIQKHQELIDKSIILPKVAQFIQRFDELEVALKYVSFGGESIMFRRSLKTVFKEAFALQDDETAVELLQKNCSGLSLEAMKRIWGSDWFHPSPYRSIELRVDRSFTDALVDKNPFLERTLDLSKTYQIKRPICFLTRTVAIFAIGLIAAPLGIAHHSKEAIRFHIQSPRDSESQFFAL
jgi:hypothetical protein